MTSLWQNVAGLAVVPLVLVVLALGYGLLIERLTRLRLPLAVLVATGFCASIVVSLAGFETRHGDALVVPMVAVPAVLGFAVGWRGLPARFDSGWPLLAALATYVLFDLSVLASGHWTWTGYNLENDSASELVLISHLQMHGTAAVTGPVSTANTALVSYLRIGYPLGSQSLLGVLSGLLGVRAVALWQGFISAMAAVGTLAASTLCGRTLAPRLAAAAAFVAVASALFYQYALQGAIKEVAVGVAVLCALAVGRYAIIAGAGARAVAVVAFPLAAILATYSAAGVPYVLALLGCGFAALLLIRRQWPRREWLLPAVGGLLLLGVLSIPVLLTVKTFFHAAHSGFSASKPTAPALGPLVRPLPLSEISGIWLYGDYRYPVVPSSAAVATTIVTVIVFMLVVRGIWRTWREREPGPLAGLAVVALVLLVVYPRVVPYAQAKLLMIASPFVVLVGLQGLSGMTTRVTKLAAALVALVISGAVLASDGLAYRNFPVAPVNRLLALEQIGHRLGRRGPVLDSEFEQFAKYFMQPASVIVGPDAPTPVPLSLRTPAPEYGHSFDLNQETLSFIEAFPYVLTRRSPVGSRPPANYRLLFSNTFYELWARQSRPRVYAHLPLGGDGLDPNHTPSCRALQAMVRGAGAGVRLAVASLPPVYGYQLANARMRSSDWRVKAAAPPGVSTYKPGRAEGVIHLPRGGRYRIWVQGDFPRTVSVTLDGRPVGSVEGTNTPGGWLSGGVVAAASGSHVLGVVVPPRNASPGNGNTQAEIDAVGLSAIGASRQIVVLPVRRWRSVCSVDANWIELISSA